MSIRPPTVVRALFGLAVFLSSGQSIGAPSASPYHYTSTSPAIGGIIVKVRPDILNSQAGVRRLGVSGGVSTQSILNLCAPLGVAKVKPMWPASNISAAGASSDIHHPAANTFVLGVDPSMDAENLSARLNRLPWVEYAEVDRLLELHQAPDDPLFVRQWDLHNTGQPYYAVHGVVGDTNDTLVERTGTPGADMRFLSAYRYDGQKTAVTVGVIDTGIDTGHVDLHDGLNSADLAGNGRDDDHNGFVDDVYGWDFSGDIPATPIDLIADNDVTDFLGHGTHVAGTIAATVDNGIGIAGLAPQAYVVGVKIFPNAFFSISAQGIYYAVDRGCRVLNMSWGGGYPSRAIADALEYAHRRGVVLVASMGNSGDDQVFYPAAHSQTIGVGASTADDRLASFSTYNDFVDIIAPGHNTLSLRAVGTDLYADIGEPNVHIIDNYYLIASGTSMAAPHVTGAAAALLSIAPGLSNERVREILMSTADDVVDPYGEGDSLPGWDRFTGAGRINIERAIAALPGVFVDIPFPRRGSYLPAGETVLAIGTISGTRVVSYALSVAPGHPPDASPWSVLTTGSGANVVAILAPWNTAGLLGPYTIRLDAGPDAILDVPVTVVPPMSVSISRPVNSDTIRLLTSVVGTAAALDFVEYRLDALGPLPNRTSNPVTRSTRPIWNDTLAIWRTDALSNGDYLLVLTLETDAGTIWDSVRVTVRDAFMAGWPVDLPRPAHFAVTSLDLDGRGTEEIVCPTAAGLYVLRADGTNYPGWPRDTTVDVSTAPAIADLDYDGKYELIVSGRSHMYVYAFIGEQYEGWPQPFLGGLRGIYGNSLPTVGNVDGTGSLEIAAIDVDGKIHVWHADGTEYLPQGGDAYAQISIVNSQRNSLPRVTVCDMDRDGRPELIASGDNLELFDGPTGLPYGRNARTTLRSHFSLHGYVVGDFDSDQIRDIAYAAADRQRGRFVIDVVDLSGASLPGWPRTIPETLDKYLLYSMAAGDVDDDGVPELFLAPYSLGEGFLYGFHANGAPVGSDSTNGLLASLSGSISSVVLADIDHDDQPEIVLRVGELISGPDRIVALEPDGSPVPGYPIAFGEGSAPVMSAPLVGDVNRDGMLDMVTVQSTSMSVAVWELRSPVSLRGRPWPKFRADLWNSGVVATPRYDIAYLVQLLVMIAGKGPALPPYEPSDLDCDGITSIADAILLTDYLYRKGPALCRP